MFGWYIAAATICGISSLVLLLKGGANNFISAVLNAGIAFLLVYAALHS